MFAKLGRKEIAYLVRCPYTKKNLYDKKIITHDYAAPMLNILYIIRILIIHLLLVILFTIFRILWYINILILRLKNLRKVATYNYVSQPQILFYFCHNYALFNEFFIFIFALPNKLHPVVVVV